MGKKPFILIALGLLVIVSAFTVGGDTDPTCGRGRTMSPGEVCVNKATGEEQTYDEAKAQQSKQIQVFMPAAGGALILYGVFVAVKRVRNPNCCEVAAAKKQAAAAKQAAEVAQAKQAMAAKGQPTQPGAQTAPPMQGHPTAPPMQHGGQPYPPQGHPAAPPPHGGQPYPPQQQGGPPQQ